MTIQQVFKKHSNLTSLAEGDYEYMIDEETFIEAAKELIEYHVKAALLKASENAFVEYTDLTDGEKFDYTDVITDDDVGADVNKDSILNSYPLDLIK